MHKDDVIINMNTFKKNSNHEDNNLEIEIVMADMITPKPQPWFWKNIIPLDTTTLFAGFGNSGKSQLLIFMAAKTSTGDAFNAGGSVCIFPQGNVIILSGEDDFNYQLIPRLIAANADLKKIHLLKMMKISGQPKKLLDLDAHLELLEKTILEAQNQGNPIKLIIIDPVQYFTGEMKDHINANVCRFIASLNDLAKKYNLSIIMNKHLRKKGSGDGASSAVDSVSGSGAWTTSPRSCWLIQRHPTKEGVILFADLKGNLKSKETKSLAYKIDEVFITVSPESQEKIPATAMTWLDKLEDFNADTALNTVSLSPVEQNLRKWMIDLLLECDKNPNNGAMFISSDLGKEAISAGYTKTTYFRVRGKMIEEGVIKEAVIGQAKKLNMIVLVDPELYK